MRWLILNYLTLIVINILMVYSATYKSLLANNESPFSEIIVIIIFELIFMVFSILVLSYSKGFKKLIDKNVYLIFWMIIGILCLVLVEGSSAGGAVSVLKLGPLVFQPMEIAKIFLIFYMAKILTKKRTPTNYEEWLKLIILPLIASFLVLKEHDLGGALIMLTLILVMIILNGKDLWRIFKAVFVLAGVVIGGILLIIKIAPSGNYQIERIGAWINPFNYLDGAGGNLLQSYIAISNGGILGNGYLHSTQNTGFLFASSSDFIFAVILEELGIIGGMVVIALITILALQIYRVGYNSQSKYNYLICSGFSALILIQTMVNIGGVTGVIPMTGVTLPFISKGINSLIFLSLGFLYVLMVKRENIQEKRNEKKNKQIKHKKIY
ncbi:MAG: FtsW/RodA/SpoVE family cell cycle protein [Mycoplasmatales bacterium]